MGLVNEMTTGRELRSLIDKRVSGLASRKLNSFYANYFLRKQKTWRLKNCINRQLKH